MRQVAMGSQVQRAKEALKRAARLGLALTTLHKALARRRVQQAWRPEARAPEAMPVPQAPEAALGSPALESESTARPQSLEATAALRTEAREREAVAPRASEAAAPRASEAVAPRASEAVAEVPAPRAAGGISIPIPKTAGDAGTLAWAARVRRESASRSRSPAGSSTPEHCRSLARMCIGFEAATAARVKAVR